jgi:hypothetical protein
MDIEVGLCLTRELPTDLFLDFNVGGTVYNMIRECAWCRRIIDSNPSERALVTHTICDSCEGHMTEETLSSDMMIRLHAFASAA